jgi:hypothetical protein
LKGAAVMIGKRARSATVRVRLVKVDERI